LIAQLLEVPVADKLTVSAEKTNAADQRKSNQKNEQPFFENDIVRIDVVSFQREGGTIELKLKYLNKTKKVISMRLNSPKENTYLVDDFGNQITFKESEIDQNTLTFPSGIPRISVIVFRDTEEGDNRNFIATAQYYQPGRGQTFFASFKGLVLR
jgi:hypothetical protein